MNSVALLFAFVMSAICAFLYSFMCSGDSPKEV